MREVKFRAWEKNLKEIIPVHNIDFDKKMINTDIAWRFLGEVELMQFTGQKDNYGEGAEIYDGDIVERVVFAFGEQRIFTGQVKMYEGAWWIDNGTASVPLWNEMHWLKVIGNIYEKPELLEVAE